MRQPRTPIARNGRLAPEWQDWLEATVDRETPREAVAAIQGRIWRNWWEAAGRASSTVRPPRGPLYGADGIVTREWRDWLDRL